MMSAAQMAAGVSPAFDGRIPESGNVRTSGRSPLCDKRGPRRPGIRMVPKLKVSGSYQAGADSRFLPSRRFVAVTMQSAE
jgi:hypothetical protein